MTSGVAWRGAMVHNNRSPSPGKNSVSNQSCSAVFTITSPTMAPPPNNRARARASASGASGSATSSAGGDGDIEGSIDKLSKQEIQAKLASGDLVTKKKKEGRGKRSVCWDVFDVIVWRATDIEVGARCTRCNAIYLSNANPTGGTSSMVKHAQSSCTKRAYDGSWKGTRMAADVLPPNLKSTLADKLGLMCAAAMCSVDLLVGNPMRELLQFAIDLGATVGHVNINDIMPSAKTVTRHLSDLTKVERAKVVADAKAAIQSGGGLSATTDMLWTCEHTQLNFLCITVHFVNSNWQPESHKLLTVQFPIDEKKTGENILCILRQEMVENLGFTNEEFEGITWVTDQGANIVKALENFEREDCLAHVGNTALKHTFTFSYMEIRQAALQHEPTALAVLQPYCEAAQIVKSCQRKLQFDIKNLKRKIILPAPARSSYAASVQSVCNNRKQVIAVLEGVGRQDLAGAILEPSDIVQDLIDFLQPLEKNGDVPDGDLLRVLEHLQIVDTDSELVKQLKARLDDEALVLDVLVGVKEGKDLIVNLKATGKMLRLSKTIPAPCKTRWNWLHRSLKVLQEVAPEVQALLGEDDTRLEHLPDDRLAEIVSFLEPFHEETIKLQGEAYPTSPLAVLSTQKILGHTGEKVEDSKAMAALRRRARRFVAAKMQPSMRHKVATMLTPAYRQLMMLPFEEQEEVKDYVRDQLRAAAVAEAEADDPGENNREATTAEPAAKRACVDLGYDEWVAAPSAPVIEDELDRYLREAPHSVRVGDGLLEYWKSQAAENGKFPNLAKLARRVMAIPATSAASERVFSDTGFVINYRRTRLAPDTVDSIIFMHGVAQLQKNNQLI